MTDLERLEDFAKIEVFEHGDKGVTTGTRVTISRLKSFVRREFRAERRKGFVRNIASHSGFEQFCWNLSRCAPIPYANRITHVDGHLKSITRAQQATLDKLVVRHGQVGHELFRPIYPLQPDSPSLSSDLLVKVAIREGGLRANGFVAGYEQVIFPAEYRGIAVRVRGVAIGEPGFLGAEFLLTGASKAALSQITGEINVSAGLDAVDAVNPGRESFYDENEHFKVLRRTLIGEGEKVTGYLGQAISAVLRRSIIRSNVRNALSKAAVVRDALNDVSAGVAYLISRADRQAISLRKMLRSTKSHTNGLASAADHNLGIPKRIGPLPVVVRKKLPQAAVVDYESDQIRIDSTRPEWDGSVVLFDRRFDVIHKHGSVDQPIGEIDLKRDRIFVNWGHAARPHMDERGFLRTSLAWVISKTAGSHDADQMMDMAVRLMSFSVRRDG